jgi:hypothetical protein
MSEKTMGQVAFEAYRAEVRTAFNGDPIPEWDALDNGAPARRGWEAAALAAIHADAGMDSPEAYRDFREERTTRWRPISATPLAHLAEVESLPPVAKHEPDPVPPVGDGGPVGGWYLTGEPVPINVEPDRDRD